MDYYLAILAENYKNLYDILNHMEEVVLEYNDDK